MATCCCISKLVRGLQAPSVSKIPIIHFKVHGNMLPPQGSLLPDTPVLFIRQGAPAPALLTVPCLFSIPSILPFHRRSGLVCWSCSVFCLGPGLFQMPACSLALISPIKAFIRSQRGHLSSFFTVSLAYISDAHFSHF